MEREISRDLLEQLNRDAGRIAARFAVAYHSIEAERPQVKRRYGVCFSDGRIRIRLRHAATGRPLKYSSLVNTLCHELAHLKHFNHGARFKAFYLKILAYARSEGIYRPRQASEFDRGALGAGPPDLGAARGVARAGPARPTLPGPEQLSLFGV